MIAKRFRSVLSRRTKSWLKALEAGKSETLVQNLTMCARFHQYSFNNCILIYLQSPMPHMWRVLQMEGILTALSERARKESPFLLR